MANRRFIDFPIASTSGDTDIILIWQGGANKQTTKATFLSGLPENLDELNDVAISGLTNGQILRYDSVTGKWENTDQGNLDLNDLNDVSIVSPSNGQVLVYNSSTSKWENSSGGFVPYVGAVTTVDLGAQGLRAGYVRFDTTVAGVPNEQGLMFWDADDETVDIILNGYTMKIGEDLFYPVKNQTGSTIAKGVAVRFNGTLGASGRLLIAPFIANGSVPSSRFMGVTAEEILNGEDGKVLYFGRVRGINTDAFNEGDILYASTTVAGGYQTAIPLPPNNIVEVAAVISKSATVGTIFVRPTLGSNINTDEGVKITSVADKNLLQYQSGTALWENKTLAQVLGGTSAQFVKGDASLDSTSYQPLLTNPVTGTGTTNYLPKFTGASTIGNSQIFDDATNVGIGTATPNTKLQIDDSNDVILTLRRTINGNAGIKFESAGTNSSRLYGASNSYALKYFYNSSEYLTINNIGNVGIGTNAPAQKLDVSTGVDADAGLIGILIGGTVANSRQALIEKQTSGTRTLSIYSSLSDSVFEAISFYTGVGAEKLRITQDGEILMGGTVELNTASTVTDLTIQGTGRGQLNIFRNDTSIADTNTFGIIGFWGNDTTSNIPKMHASIEAAASGTHSAGSNPTDLIFTTTSSASETKAERMRITSDSYLRMASGSGGIQFNGDTAAANALDDYEEGTWTPTYVGSGGGSVTSYSAQSGTYTKIGNVVTLTISIAAAKGTISGDISIGGIPYSGSSYYVNMTTRRRFATDFQLMGVVGASQITLFKVKSNELSTLPITASDFSSTATNTYNSIIATITYRTT